MRHAVLLAASLALLLPLPSCLPIGGCGGPGDHTMVVDGPVAMSLSAPVPTAGCFPLVTRDSFTFEVSDPSAFALLPDDAGVAVRAAELDPTDFEATGTLSIQDEHGPVDLDLTFGADGTITGTATRTITSSCSIAYTVGGTFTPVYE